jgi:2-polyprenyl-3-methyl-5-hydroxy-6-metoxy-1,4-benzoquinol methylase
MQNETSVYYTSSRPEIASFVPVNTRTILDVGCGQGYFLKLVKEQIHAETWGDELMPEVAEKAKAQVDHVIPGKIEEALDLIPDHYFDCITFNDVLEHLPEPAEILRRMKPKLTKNGIIIASIPSVRYFYNLVELIIKKDWEYKDSGILDATHLRFFTQKSMKRMFENAGYFLVNVKGVNGIKYWKFQLLNFVTFGLINDTKYLQYVCMAKKKVNEPD